MDAIFFKDEFGYFELVFEWIDTCGGQQCTPIFSPFALMHDDLLVDEIDIFDTQLKTLV